MTDYRWVLINIMPCKGSVVLSGSGNSSVDGTYCYDGLNNEAGVWTKIGGVRLEDSIYRPTYEGEGLPYLVVTTGGTFEDDPTNALYKTVFGFGPGGAWTIQDAFGLGGTPPPPIGVYYPEKEPVLKDFGPLQYARFSEDEDLSVGLIAKRRKLTTDIVFSGEDYHFFRAIEKDPVRRCEELIIRRQMKCGSKWETIWTGTFSTGSGSWDLDNCLFTVRPEVLDEYTCIMRGMNKKVNALQVAPVTAQAVIIPSLEFAVCRIGGGIANNCVAAGVLDVDGTTPINEWVIAHNQSETACDPGPNETTYNLVVFWRERVNTFCVAGAPVSPVGSGWVLLTDNCATTGTAVYVREPTISWTFGDATVIENTDPVAIPPDTDCAWTYLGSIDIENEIQPFCFGVWHHAFICLSAGTPVVFDRARTLQEVANYMLGQAGCDQTEMVSDFFEWNAPGDAPGYLPGVNYVTGLGSQTNALVLLQNSDAIDPGATNPATIGELTLKEFFTLLATAYRTLWAIDSEGRVRIEHFSYWTSPVGLVLSDYPKEERTEPMQYAYLKSEVPRYERPRWAAARGSDFIGSDIEYTGPCVSNEAEADVKEYSVGQFTSDIELIVVDPDSVSKQGFTILATAFNGTEYNAILDHGALSGNFITNAPLAWANLERDFWQHDRFLPSGIMNRVITDFIGFIPNIEQRDVFVKMCCDYRNFNSSNRVTTALGGKLGGINAFIRRAEFDEKSVGVTLTLRYAY